MSDQIRQHQSLARGEGLNIVPSIESPFGQVKGSDIPRGEMKDGQRAPGVLHTSGHPRAQANPDHGE